MVPVTSLSGAGTRGGERNDIVGGGREEHHTDPLALKGTRWEGGRKPWHTQEHNRTAAAGRKQSRQQRARAGSIQYSSTPNTVCGKKVPISPTPAPVSLRRAQKEVRGRAGAARGVGRIHIIQYTRKGRVCAHKNRCREDSIVKRTKGGAGKGRGGKGEPEGDAPPRWSSPHGPKQQVFMANTHRGGRTVRVGRNGGW